MVIIRIFFNITNQWTFKQFNHKYYQFILKFIIIVSLMSFIPQKLWGQQLILLSDEQGNYPLGKQLEILEDKNGQLTLAEVTSTEISPKFVKSEDEIPSFGFTNSVYWVRFQLQNTSHEVETWLLEMSYPSMDLIELYTFDEKGNKTHQKQGDLFPFSNRDVIYRNFIFQLSLKANTNKTVYMRFKSESSMILHLTVWAPITFAEKLNLEQYVYGIYYGIMIVMILYNFFLFISIRDRNYLLYVMFIGCFMLFLMALNGLAFELLWPEHPGWANKSIPIFVALATFFGPLFSAQFVVTKVHSPKLHKAIMLIIVSSGFVPIFTFIFSYAIMIKVSVFLAFWSGLLVPIAGFFAFIKGYRPARFFMIAWIVVLSGVVLFSAKTFGWIPTNFVTTYSMQIGSALEVILLSLALADRINLMKIEKEQALAKALQASEESNKLKEEYSRNLELKVEERTYELNDKNLQLIIQAKEIEAQHDLLVAVNKRLDQSLDYMKILAEISKEITATLDLENVLNTVYTHTNSLMDATTFMICLYHEKSGIIEVPYNIEKGQRMPTITYSIDDDDRIGSWCLRNRKEVFMNDCEKDYESYKPAQNYTLTGESTESLIFLPLIVKDKAIGLITVQSFKKNAYTKHHLDILKSLAAYTAIALDNAHVYQQLGKTQNRITQQANEINHMNEILQAVNETLDLNRITEVVMKALKQLCSYDFAGILLINHEKQILDSTLSSERHEHIISKLQLSIPLDEDNSIFIRTIKRKKRFLVKEITPTIVNKFSYSDKKWYQVVLIKSGVVFPLIYRQEAIGTIFFASFNDRLDLSRDKLNTIERYIGQLSAAIYNAKLYRQMSDQKAILEEKNNQIIQQAQEISHMNEVALLVNSTLDIQQINIYIMQILKNIFDYDIVGIYIIDEAQNQMKSILYWDYNSQENHLKFSDNVIPLDETESIIVKTVNRGKRFYLRRISPERAAKFSPADLAFHEANPLVSVLVFPLKLHNKVIGTISFGHSCKPFNLTPPQMDTIQRYVNQITASIHNAQLYEEINNQKKLLESALNNLKATQTQLVEAEKMASLGGLVAGIAHEINTPLGIALTAASYLENQTRAFTSEIEEGKLKRSTLNTYVKIAGESSQMVVNNVQRAAELVQSFKQVAVDQSSEIQRTFKIKDYIEGILLSLKPKLKKTNHKIVIECQDDLELTSYPGAFSQVVTNLVINTLFHAYGPEETGILTFSIWYANGYIHFIYSDDGIGMDAEVSKKAFEPFFTTKRNQGGSGLGLHIVYNLVTQRLKGTIKLESTPKKGTRFYIDFPCH